MQRNVGLVHTTPGYDCAKAHQISDWLSGFAMSLYRTKSVIDTLGVTRGNERGNGCLD